MGGSIAEMTAEPIQILRLPEPTADLEQAKRDLVSHGLCLVRDALAPTQVDAARARLAEQAEAEVQLGRSYHDGGPPGAPQPNQRVWNLINKGEIFREIAVAPHALELVRSLLGRDILLSSMTANIARRGGAPMAIHTDQNYVPTETPYPMVVDIAWMLVDFTEANGATRVIPGSHRWNRLPRYGEHYDTIPAVGPAGTALVFDGRLWHGTGANVTDEPRHALFTYFCRAFVRQQENFTLSTSPEVLQRCSGELKALLGFQVWNTLGMVEGSRHGQYVDRPEQFSHEAKPR
jgi:ectoine hydroxylase-related dioxygenase (phytanoyl-CoA dioxygenase family)